MIAWRPVVLGAAVVVAATCPACASPQVAQTATPTGNPTRIIEAPVPSSTSAPATTVPSTVTRSMPTPTATPIVTETPTRTAVVPSPSAASPSDAATGPEPPARPALGDEWIRPGDGMVMVFAPGGSFTMGGDPDDEKAREDEFPAHLVSLDGFWIDKTEVNNEQYAAFLNVHGNAGEDGRRMVALGQSYCQIREKEGVFSVANAADRPVVMVTWYGAEAYCAWVGGRLPTEAEWEYAARGPEGHLYPWGDEPPNCELARFGDCARSPIAAGSLAAGASWCGALDMAGNVWEWVADWHGRYPAGARENPTGPEAGRIPVQRGGGWHSPWWELRATYRQHDTARTSYNG